MSISISNNNDIMNIRYVSSIYKDGLVTHSHNTIELFENDFIRLYFTECKLNCVTIDKVYFNLKLESRSGDMMLEAVDQNGEVIDFVKVNSSTSEPNGTIKVNLTKYFRKNCLFFEQINSIFDYEDIHDYLYTDKYIDIKIKNDTQCSIKDFTIYNDSNPEEVREYNELIDIYVDSWKYGSELVEFDSFNIGKIYINTKLLDSYPLLEHNDETFEKYIQKTVNRGIFKFPLFRTKNDEHPFQIDAAYHLDLAKIKLSTQYLVELIQKNTIIKLTDYMDKTVSYVYYDNGESVDPFSGRKYYNSLDGSIVFSDENLRNFCLRYENEKDVYFNSNGDIYLIIYYSSNSENVTIDLYSNEIIIKKGQTLIKRISIDDQSGYTIYSYGECEKVKINENELIYMVNDLVVNHIEWSSCYLKDVLNNIEFYKKILGYESTTLYMIDKYLYQYTKGKSKMLQVSVYERQDNVHIEKMEFKDEFEEITTYHFDNESNLIEIIDSSTGYKFFKYPNRDFALNRRYGYQTAQILNPINISENISPVGFGTVISNTEFPQTVGGTVLKVQGSISETLNCRKEIICNIMPKETWKFTLFAKFYGTESNYLKVKLIFKSLFNDEEDEIIEQKFLPNYDGFQAIEFTHMFNKRCRQIIVEYIFEGYADYYIGKCYCQKAKNTNNSKSTDLGKFVNTEIPNKIVEYDYDNSYAIKSVKTSSGEFNKIDDQNFYDCRTGISNVKEMDSYARVEKEYNTNFKGIRSENLYYYDEDIKNNLREVQNNRGQKINYTYNTNNQIVSEEMVFENEDTTNTYTKEYSYSQNDLTKYTTSLKSENDNHLTQEETEIDFSKNINLSNEYMGKEETISTNGITYKTVYDEYNRVDEEKINNYLINKYQYAYDTILQYPINKVISVNHYNEFSTINRYFKDLIMTSQTLSKGTIYSYLNELGIKSKQISKIEYGTMYNNNTDVDYDKINLEYKKEFEYDDFLNISKITSTDLSHQMDKTETIYKYDESNELSYTKDTIGDTSNHYFHDGLKESQENNIFGFISRLNVHSFNDYLFPNNINEMMYNKSLVTNEVNLIKDSYIKRYVYTLDSNLSSLSLELCKLNEKRVDTKYFEKDYKKLEFENSLQNRKVLSMCIKVTKNDDQFEMNNMHIMTFYNESDGLIDVKMNTGYEIFVEVNNQTYNTNLKLTQNEWIYFEVVLDSDISIRVNNDISFLSVNGQSFTDITHISIGNKLTVDNTNKIINNFTLYLMYASIGNDRLIPQENTTLVKELIQYINNSFFDSHKTTIYHQNNELIELVPLNGTFPNTLQPIEYEVSKKLSMNYSKDLFYFDQDLRRYVFCSKIKDDIVSLLGYNLNLQNNYLLYLRFKTENYPDETQQSYLISNYKDILQWSIGLSHKGTLIIYYNNSGNNQQLDTGIKIKLSDWYDLFVQVKNNTIEITLNETVYEFENLQSLSLSECCTYIGSGIQFVNASTKAVFNFEGFVDVFGYKDESTSITTDSEIQSLRQYNKPISRETLTDIDGKLKQTTIISKTKKLKHYYRYYEDSYINNIPTYEQNEVNECFNYLYDEFDNIIVKEQINENKEIIEKFEYEYDYLNRLTKETKKVLSNNTLIVDYQYIYVYDESSNIIRKTKTITNNVIDMTYTYSNSSTNNTYQNVLTSYSVNNVTNVLSYNSLVGPSNINDTSLEWTNKLLTKYGDITFEYNESGQRTKKITNNYSVYYYYEGNKIVKSTKQNNSINYIYDNDYLFGLIYKNKDYYYIRDLMGNINKIVDSNGVTMVKYNYTAYGEVTMENPFTQQDLRYITSQELMSNNELLYKGYCYDVETSLFWLSSRYYSPELCRFISPDDVEYLDPESVNGLNLYCYCKNNPIMYADPSGHFTILALFISFVASVAFEIIEDAMDGELFTDDSHNGWDYLGAGISGLFGGLSPVGGTLVKQIGSQVLFSLVGGFADAAISGDLKENGFWNTMGSIVLSTTVSIGVGALSKWGVSKMKASSLRKLGSNNAANRVLGKMGVSGKIGKKSNTVLSKMIKNSNWIGNIIADYGASSIMGGVLSMVWGYHFDGRWF